MNVLNFYTHRCLKAKLQILQQEIEISRKDNVAKTELLAERTLQLDKSLVDKEHIMKIHKDIENQCATLRKKQSDLDAALRVCLTTTMCILYNKTG